MSELKPCPFCGETPDSINDFGMMYHEPSSCMLGNSSWDIDDWNRRAPIVKEGVE